MTTNAPRKRQSKEWIEAQRKVPIPPPPPRFHIKHNVNVVPHAWRI